MGLRSGLAGLARRRPDAVKVWLAALIADGRIELKVGIEQGPARDPDDRGQLPDEPAVGPPPDGGHAGPALEYPDYWQVTAATRPTPDRETRIGGGPRRPPRSNTETNFWGSLSSAQRRAFSTKAHKRVFVAGARLMLEGEEGDYVAVILSGLTEIRVWENGTERVVARRGPGQLIGERAALEINPRSATVVARETVTGALPATREPLMHPGAGRGVLAA